MTRRTHIVGPCPGHDHTHTVILLHGRDSDCAEFASDFFESEASEPAGQPRTLPDLFPTIKWVFPAAPVLHSVRFDTEMSQWYDMWSVENPNERVELQKSGLRQSTDAILEIIWHEERVVSRDKIFLGGISQGFTVAISAFFADGKGLAGLLGFCSWMPLPGTFISEDITQGATNNDLERLQQLYSGKKRSDMSAADSMKATPILLAHSQDDSVVPVENGRSLHELLVMIFGQKEVEWHEYCDGGHWINEPQGVDDIVAFFRAHMQ